MKTVAVLDDDPSLVELFLNILHEEGYRAEALLVSSHPDNVLDQISLLKPDLLILDVRIGGLKCIEVVKGLHKVEANGQLKILLCTAARRELTELKAQLTQEGLPVPPVLEKPFDLDEFIAVVKQLVS